ncbi:unnamed protein product [Rotaria sordida]|uniref:Apple domain-containing protein n=1 Tax=Rotaria sordida TaxID=392033 RepID=A0A814IX36_9BILA|nr:unnamed protein product [Rotaria sordida]
MLIITIIFLKLLILVTHQQQYKVRFQLTPFGIEFQYGNINDLYSNRLNVPSITRCAMICSMEKICQTFDYDASSHVCRLFSIWADQGTFVPSTSQVGYVQQTTELYSLYQKSCNISHDINRYLSCTDDGLWMCQSGQIYNGIVCQYEVIYSYTTVSYEQECRQNQIMQWNGTHCLPGVNGSSNNQLNFPFDLAHDPNSGTLYISDSWNHRVMSYIVNASSGTVVAGGNGPGTSNIQLNYPIGIYLDLPSNSLFIANYNSNNIVRWVLGASSWTLVAGSSTGVNGTSSTLLYGPFDVTVDFMGNVYVADTLNHRIQFFLAGSLNGTTIAGVTGTFGSDSFHFYYSYALALDSQLNFTRLKIDYLGSIKNLIQLLDYSNLFDFDQLLNLTQIGCLEETCVNQTLQTAYSTYQR